MRAALALFPTGLVTFAFPYYVQPIFSALSQEFGLIPANNSVSLPVSMATLVTGLLFAGPLFDAISHKPAMIMALLLASTCTLLSIMVISWHGILITHVLIGPSLSGVVVVGTTYLNEGVHLSFVIFSMGLYISGNSIGGVSGRLINGVFTDPFS